MAKFIIEEVREIIKGFYSQNYEVEAETREEAIEKIKNMYDEDETDIEYLDQTFDIRDSEFLNFNED